MYVNISTEELIEELLKKEDIDFKQFGTLFELYDNEFLIKVLETRNLSFSDLENLGSIIEDNSDSSIVNTVSDAIDYIWNNSKKLDRCDKKTMMEIIDLHDEFIITNLQEKILYEAFLKAAKSKNIFELIDYLEK